MKAEDIFNENAKQVMFQWSLDDFKKTHPHLCKVVLNSINQALNLHDVVGRSEQCCSPPEGFYLGMTRQKCNKPFRSIKAE